MRWQRENYSKKVHISHLKLLVCYSWHSSHGAGILNLIVSVNLWRVFTSINTERLYIRGSLSQQAWSYSLSQQSQVHVSTPMDLAGSCFHIIQKKILSQMVNSVLRDAQTITERKNQLMS